MIRPGPEMLFPGAGVDLSPLLLLALGFTVGVCSGFFGLGGGFMVTPGLNIFGLPITFAVGTSMTQIFGTAFIAAAKHRKLGQVDFKLAFLLVLGNLPGMELGKNLLIWWEEQGQAEYLVRYLYIVLLAGLGMFLILDYLRSAFSIVKGKPSEYMPSRLAKLLQGIRIRPFLSLPKSGIYRISLWSPLALGFFTGMLAGVLGVGGGFILMPALIYLIGLPVVVAIGTGLSVIIIAGAYGSFTYALVNRVELLMVFFMLLGSAAGAQIGVIATRYIQGKRIILLFSITILLTGLSVALKQVAAYYNLANLSDFSGFLLLGAAGGMSLVITGLFIFEKLKRFREREKAK